MPEGIIERPICNKSTNFSYYSENFTIQGSRRAYNLHYQYV